MSFELRIEITGEEALVRSFDLAANELADFEPAFREVAKLIPQFTAEAFDAEGPNWAPLSKSYAAWKALHFPGRPILVRTGVGKAQATSEHGWATTITPDTLEMIYHGPPYMVRHQLGGGRLPQRQWLDLTPARQERLWTVFQRQRLQALEKTGLLQGGAP